MSLNTSVTLGGGPYTSPVGGSLDMMPVLLKKKLLAVIERNLVFDRIADHEALPQGSGRTVRWTRYERIGLPFKPIDEGLTPADIRSIPVTAVEASVDQWGDITGFTDVADMTLAHKPLQIHLDRMGVAAAELHDREAQRALLGGGTLILPVQSYTSRAQITVNDWLDLSTLRRAIANLRDSGAPDFDGYYIGVMDPYIEMDLMKDPTFAAMATQQKAEPLLRGRLVREWGGVKWMTTNHIPYIVLDTNAAGTITTPADAANTLPTNKDIKITGLTDFGHETQIGAIVTPAAFAANDVIQIILAAPVAPIVRFNIYAGEVGAGLTLQGEALTAGTYLLTATGISAVAGTAIRYTTTGRAAPVTPASGVKVHQTYLFAREALANVELSGTEVLITESKATDSDPLKQRRKVSYKMMMKYAIKNPAFFRRIESESDHD